MEITETQSEGLARQFRVVIPAAELNGALDNRLEELKGQIRLKGFRPGKVPVSYLKKTYGKALMSEIIEEKMRQVSFEALEERSLRPATQPKIDFAEDNVMEEVVTGASDLKYTIDLEIIPEFEPTDLAKIEIKRPVAPVEPTQVDEMLANLRQQQTSFEARPEDQVAINGDRLIVDFVGKIDGEAFEGGTAEGAQVVLGSGRMIPGFEEQLLGAKAGEERVLNVTFPEDYPAEELKGKAATFDATVKEVAEPKEPEDDKAVAEAFGFEDAEAMRKTIEERFEAEHAQLARGHAKRRLLDALDEAHDFALPAQMVDMEFNQIWSQVEQAEDGKKEIEEKGEEAVRAEYKTIAERRVRLGLVLAELGRRNTIEVTDEELNRALADQARQYPGKEQEVVKFYRENPMAVEQLRAPIFEDKVVDFALEQAQVTDETVSLDDLRKDPDEDPETAQSDSKKAEDDKAEEAS